MTNIEQFTRELMLAHDIDYKTALSRAEQFYDMLDTDRPEVLSGWISVEDKLPEHMQPILVYGKKSKSLLLTSILIVVKNGLVGSQIKLKIQK